MTVRSTTHTTSNFPSPNRHQDKLPVGWWSRRIACTKGTWVHMQHSTHAPCSTLVVLVYTQSWRNGTSPNWRHPPTLLWRITPVKFKGANTRQEVPPPLYCPSLEYISTSPEREILMVLTLWGLFFVTTFPQSKGSLSKKGTFSCPGDFASSPPIPKSSMFLAQLISDIQSFQILGRGGGISLAKVGAEGIQFGNHWYRPCGDSSSGR